MRRRSGLWKFSERRLGFCRDVFVFGRLLVGTQMHITCSNFLVTAKIHGRPIGIGPLLKLFFYTRKVKKLFFGHNYVFWYVVGDALKSTPNFAR